MKKPLLVFATLNGVVADFLCQSIRNVLGENIEVAGYAEDRKNYIDREPSLVVSSGPYCDDLAESIFPNAKRMTAYRVLTASKLEQVMNVPIGTNVLVISNKKAISQETVDALRQSGLDHLNYDCWWTGSNVDASKYEYALSPGVQHLCPYEFKHLIDLGQKALSVRTFSEIVKFFRLDSGYIDIYENQYIKSHVDVCKRMMYSLTKVSRELNVQEQLYDTIDEAIVCIDRKNNILYCNKSARNLFNIAKAGDILQSAEFVRIIKFFSNNKARMDISEDALIYRLTISGEKIVCERRKVGSSETQYMYIFRRESLFSRLKTSVRSQLEASKPSTRYTFNDIWGDNQQVVQLKERAEAFAKTGSAVLITGESGTGKEMLAQSIHNASPRASKPFIGVNLSAMPQALIESELFGYEEASFTGAQRGGKKGILEAAAGGTIFLDEIGDIPPNIQVLLLRVLEERTFSKVGSYQLLPFNARIIAATNRPLYQMVKDGIFRQDLFYRLNVLSLQTVPLRNMMPEINGFLENCLTELCHEEIAISDDAISALQKYSWPGNFRELKNLAEYLSCSTLGKAVIELSDLPEYILHEVGEAGSIIEIKQKPQPVLQDGLALQILQLLNGSPFHMGRTHLQKLLTQRGFSASEYEVRKAYQFLRQNDLISSGSTRQGTTITEKGAELLKGCN